MTNLPLNIDWQQILLHLFNFTILFGGLYFLLYAPVKKFMEQREEKYAEAAEFSQANLAEAQTVKKMYQQKMDNADAEIEQSKARAREEIEKLRTGRINEAEEEASRIVSRAREQAEYEKERILTEAQVEIAKMVANTTEKLALDASAEYAYEQFLNSASNESLGGNADE